MSVIVDMIEWLHSLPADFAFLLGLPFLVAAAGLIAEWHRDRDKARGQRL